MNLALVAIQIMLGELLSVHEYAYAIEKHYHGIQGGSILLQCTYPKRDDVFWFWGNMANLLMVKRRDGNITLPKEARWEGRTEIVNASLQIQNLTIDDSGVYICKSGSQKNTEISLNVTESILTSDLAIRTGHTQSNEETTVVEEDRTRRATNPELDNRMVIYIAVGVGGSQILFLGIIALACAILCYSKREKRMATRPKDCAIEKHISTANHIALTDSAAGRMTTHDRPWNDTESKTTDSSSEHGGGLRQIYQPWCERDNASSGEYRGVSWENIVKIYKNKATHDFYDTDNPPSSSVYSEIEEVTNRWNPYDQLHRGKL